MSRDGAIIFADLIGKLDVLRVSCEKCGRDGHYILARLIRKRGRNAKLIDWIDELTAECPKRVAHNMNNPCGVRCPTVAEGVVTGKVFYPIVLDYSEEFLPNEIGTGVQKRRADNARLTL